MSVRDWIGALLELWPNLPGLVGADWPVLAPRLAVVVGRLVAATSDEERARRASELLMLLRPYEDVRRRLHAAASSIERTRHASGPKTGGPPSWTHLTGALAAAAAKLLDVERPAEQQWINAAFEGHDAHQPLYPDVAYILAFDVDTAARPDTVSTERADLAFGPDEDTIDLTVKLLSPDVEVQPDEATLTVARFGPSRNQARFQVTPRRPGEAILNALFLRNRNFVQLMTLRVQVAASDSELDTQARGRPLAAAAKVHERDLSIVLVEKADGYEIILTAARSMSERLPHTRHELDDIVVQVRQALQDLVHLDVPGHGTVYQTALDIPAPVHEQALRRLARAGNLMYRRLFFHPGGGDGLRQLGRALQQHTEGVRQRIQVVSQGLLLPWHLMYPTTEFAEHDVTAERILGLRHQIEYIPLDASTSAEVVDVEIDTSSGVNVVLAVNEDIDHGGARRLVTGQLEYWLQRAGHDLQVDVRRDRDKVVELLADSVRADQIMYFYCHAVSTRLGEEGGPTRSRLILTGQGVVVLADLQVDAPIDRRLRGTPLVVLNACESSGSSPLFYDGFLPYFIAKGARGVVGTEADTPAVFAAAWAERFFDRLLAGESIGEIVLEIRREFVQRHRNLLGLLYALYCDGDTVLRPGLAR